MPFEALFPSFLLAPFLITLAAPNNPENSIARTPSVHDHMHWIWYRRCRWTEIEATRPTAERRSNVDVKFILNSRPHKSGKDWMIYITCSQSCRIKRTPHALEYMRVFSSHACNRAYAARDMQHALCKKASSSQK